MSILRRLNSLLAAALPASCHLCGKDSGASYLCSSCLEALPTIARDPLCPVCANRSPNGVVCGQCIRKAPHFDASHALWRYEFPVDRLIQELKYAHHIAGIRFFADKLVGFPITRLPDVIIPVPLSKQRLRERGFNQSLEIARRLARHIGVPIETNAIRRTVDTSPQASLPWKARETNIRGAFECRADLTGCAVLVIDDVMTTGATLNEVAKVLKSHGAIWVGNLVLARALRD